MSAFNRSTSISSKSFLSVLLTTGNFALLSASTLTGVLLSSPLLDVELLSTSSNESLFFSLDGETTSSLCFLFLVCFLWKKWMQQKKSNSQTLGQFKTCMEKILNSTLFSKNLRTWKAKFGINQNPCRTGQKLKFKRRIFFAKQSSAKQHFFSIKTAAQSILWKIYIL